MAQSAKFDAIRKPISPVVPDAALWTNVSYLERSFDCSENLNRIFGTRFFPGFGYLR